MYKYIPCQNVNFIVILMEHKQLTQVTIETLIYGTSFEQQKQNQGFANRKHIFKNNFFNGELN